MGRPTGNRGQTAAGAGLALGAALGIPAQAQAADFNVSNLNDAGAGSLRQAALDAAGNPGHDRVLFASGLSGQIDLTTGQVALTDVDVVGPGSSQLAVNQATASSRVFYAPNVSGTVSISGLTITGGDPLARGGGVFTFNQDLTLDHVVITGNQASKGGGVALYQGGATITNSTISGNSSASRGGGIFLYAGLPVDNGSGWTIQDSVVSGNSSGSRGGGVFFYKGTAPVQVVDSTVSDNTSANRGGGLFFYKVTGDVVGTTISGNTSNSVGGGGGIFFYKGSGADRVVDSTISGNQTPTGHGGGIVTENLGATMTIDSSTIAGNTAGTTGGGIHQYGSPTGSETIVNTVLADNTAPAGPDFNDVRPAVSATAGFDLFETAPAGNPITESPAGSNIMGKDPQLQPLADNGGLTQTQALPSTSPAINQGSSALPTDQRGMPRVVEFPGVPNSTAAGANGADIGAYELQVCQTSSLSGFKPKRRVRGGQKASGVRARINVSQPSRLDVHVIVAYREGGQAKQADLGTRSLHADKYRNLRIVLPAGLAKKLPVGSKVTLTLKIKATPDSAFGCVPFEKEQSIKTRVKKILRAPQRYSRD